MKLPHKPRSIVKPAADARGIADAARSTLADALSRIMLQVREPGTDITLGTTFYTPVVTLLARGLGTKRQDLVFCAWPLLGCPHYYYESALPTLYIGDPQKQCRVSFREMLDTRMAANDGRPAVLWEILDLMQSQVGWKLRDIVQWVRVVEGVVVREHAGLLMQLQAMADTARARHDADGMLSKEIGLAEGFVVKVDGAGRVQ